MWQRQDLLKLSDGYIGVHGIILVKYVWKYYKRIT